MEDWVGGEEREMTRSRGRCRPAWRRRAWRTWEQWQELVRGVTAAAGLRERRRLIEGHDDRRVLVARFGLVVEIVGMMQ